jgi:hypothetical protein
MQGRKVRALRNVRKLSDVEFAYGGYVYHIDSFEPHKDIDIDKSDVEPVRIFEGSYEKSSSKKNKKKGKAHKRTYVALLYSNIGECADVESILNQG